MKFPFMPKGISHKHGGKILSIVGIEHVTDKPKDGRSRDSWHYLGRVQWNDGSGERETVVEIAPWAVCYDSPEGEEEIGQLSEALMDYLRKHGEWCDPTSKHKGWYAHRKERREA